MYYGIRANGQLSPTHAIPRRLLDLTVYLYERSRPLYVKQQAHNYTLNKRQGGYSIASNFIRVAELIWKKCFGILWCFQAPFFVLQMQGGPKSKMILLLHILQNF